MLLQACCSLLRQVLTSQHDTEELDLVEKSTQRKGGRKITSQGQRDMDVIAGRCKPSSEQEDEEEEDEE